MYTRAQETWFHLQTRHYFLPLHCLHADWDRDQPSLPFKSHKTINLTSTDHPILLGSSEKSAVNSSLDFTSRVSTDTQAPREPPTRTVIVSETQSLQGNPGVWAGCASQMNTLWPLSPRRMWHQVVLMEDSVSSRSTWGTKVTSRAHNQKGCENGLHNSVWTVFFNKTKHPNRTT